MEKCVTTGKLRYPARADARQALDKLRVRRAGHLTEKTAYQCRYCGDWHLTKRGEKRGPRMEPAKRWRWKQER